MYSQRVCLFEMLTFHSVCLPDTTSYSRPAIVFRGEVMACCGCALISTVICFYLYQALVSIQINLLSIELHQMKLQSASWKANISRTSELYRFVFHDFTWAVRYIRYTGWSWKMISFKFSTPTFNVPTLSKTVTNSEFRGPDKPKCPTSSFKYYSTHMKTLETWIRLVFHKVLFNISLTFWWLALC